jgi:hypothetical protein
MFRRRMGFSVVPSLMFASLCMAAAPGVPWANQVPPPNLIQNPGFEDTPPGPIYITTPQGSWLGEERGQVAVVNDGHSHSGTQEALLNGGGQLFQMFHCLANTDYVVSAWIGSTGLNIGSPFLGMSALGGDPDGDGDTNYDRGTLLNSVTMNFDGSGNYRLYTFTVNSGANTKLIVGFWGGSTGLVRVDDVSVREAGSGPQPPTITMEPASQLVAVGQTATFSVTANGTAPLAYQWQKNGTNIPGATGASYTTPPTTASDNGQTFHVVVTNSVGSVTSSAATLTVGSSGGGPLPNPWKDGDIGSVGVSGSASFSSGTFTVRGAGADIGGTADSFNYVHQQLSGDCTLIAHVMSLGNTSPGAQAGVMIRETLSPASTWADMLITPGRGASFQGRTQTGSPNFNDGGPSVTVPYWLRISRTGDAFTGSSSPDGHTWTDAGTATIPMAQTVFVGLAVVSQNTGALETATFDSVTTSGGGSGIPIGQVISLKSLANNLFVCADNAGASPLIANRTVASTWESFLVVDQGNGNVALRSLANNLYVSADNDSSPLTLIANRTVASNWETFKWIALGNGDVAFQSVVNSLYVCADHAGASPLICNRTTIGQWETFHDPASSIVTSGPGAAGLSGSSGSGACGATGMETLIVLGLLALLRRRG